MCRPEWHWEWIGNSLHPYYEGNDPAAMIDDDALIQATLQHWHWGQDGSGDIRRPENVTAICASASAMAKDLGTGGAMLVTADGSIDCQENPNEQVWLLPDHAMHDMLLMHADKFVVGICMFEWHTIANVAWLLMSALISWALAIVACRK